MTDTTKTTTALPELLDAYPGGISGLERDTRTTYSTLWRLRRMDHNRTPWKVIRAIAGARGWDEVPALPQADQLQAKAEHYVRACVRAMRVDALVASWRATKETA